MSWTGQFFNPKLRNRFNNDIHGQYSTDAYQAFNNIIGFWGELGLIGFITYYYFLFYLLYLFRKFRITDKENYAVLIMTISLGVLFSTLVQVFDDAYYSLSFWLFLAIILKILLSNKNIVKTPLKSRVIYRKRYTNNIDEIQ
jgi:O-antigen ligase